MRNSQQRWGPRKNLKIGSSNGKIKNCDMIDAASHIKGRTV